MLREFVLSHVPRMDGAKDSPDEVRPASLSNFHSILSVHGIRPVIWFHEFWSVFFVSFGTYFSIPHAYIIRRYVCWRRPCFLGKRQERPRVCKDQFGSFARFLLYISLFFLWQGRVCYYEFSRVRHTLVIEIDVKDMTIWLTKWR